MRESPSGKEVHFGGSPFGVRDFVFWEGDHLWRSPFSFLAADGSGAKGDSTTAGGFGSFDFAVAVPANKAGKDGFDAGDSAVFEFTARGNGSIDASDFTAGLSVTGKGDVAAFAAAKFVGKSSGAVGAAHAPEPSAALRLGLGLAGLSLLSSRGKVEARAPGVTTPQNLRGSGRRGGDRRADPDL